MKIALAQTEIIWEDKKQNYSNAEKIIKGVSSENADIVFFPEMSFTGFSMNTEVTKENKSVTIEYCQNIAKKCKIAIGFGWVKDCGEKCENHYTVVNEAGKIISDYAKIHPFSFSDENKFFRGGSSLAKFEFDKVKFSTFICYDLRFPEIFQAVSNDVSVIIVPANWPESRSEHWKCLLKARAIENQVYLIAVNCVGNVGGIRYSGDSCIIDPDGKIQYIISDKPGTYIFDFSDDTDKYRLDFPMKQDRKEKFYQQLILTKMKGLL